MVEVDIEKKPPGVVVPMPAVPMTVRLPSVERLDPMLVPATTIPDTRNRETPIDRRTGQGEEENETPEAPEARLSLPDSFFMRSILLFIVEEMPSPSNRSYTQSAAEIIY